MILLVVLSIGAALGFALGASYGSAHANVALSFINSTSKHIASIRIAHEDATELVENIPPSKTRNAAFVARGEAGYFLLITFSDGSTIQSNERYAEGGYRVSERISDHGVNPDFSVY